jgi:integrase
MPNITKTFVDTLEPRASDYFVWDDKLEGFGVRVYPRDRKEVSKRVYVFQYKVGKQTRRLVLGPHGAITAEEARKRAARERGKVSDGRDPAAERKAEMKAQTVKELCDAYLEATDKGLVMGKRRRPKKASTIATDRGRIERHILPLLGNRKVKDLTAPDIIKFMRDVTAGKTACDVKTGKRGRAIVEGGAGTAARTVGLLGGILSYAVSEGIIATNPARGIKRPSDNRREARLTPDEYRALGKALDAADNEAENSTVIAIARLLAYTGCRRGEIENLKWSEVDEAGQCLRLSDSKEGASIRPAGTAVFDVLRKVDRREKSPYVFPGASDDKPFKGFPKGWLRIAKRAGFSHTPHVLRHSHASVANDLGLTEATISAIQGRSTKTVTGGYIHHLDNVLIAAADKVTRAVEAMMSGTAAEVVALPTVRRKRT